MLDLIVIAIIILAFVINFRRGLIKSVWKIVALVLTIVLAITLKAPMVNFLAETEFADHIYSSVQERISIDVGEEELVQVGENAGLPDYLVAEMINVTNLNDGLSNVVNDGTNEIARRLTMLMLRIISIVILFILIRLLLAAAFTILNTVTKLPLLSQANRLLGGLFGVINSLAIIYIACAVLSLLPLNDRLYDLINQSYIVKYFYNYNILLQLIMKF